LRRLLLNSDSTTIVFTSRALLLKPISSQPISSNHISSLHISSSPAPGSNLGIEVFHAGEQGMNEACRVYATEFSSTCIDARQVLACMNANSDGGSSGGSSAADHHGDPCSLASTADITAADPTADPPADVRVDSLDAHAVWSKLRWPAGVAVRPKEKRLRGYLIKVRRGDVCG
jgi:hypothetical protein